MDPAEADGGAGSGGGSLDGVMAALRGGDRAAARRNADRLLAGIGDEAQRHQAREWLALLFDRGGDHQQAFQYMQAYVAAGADGSWAPTDVTFEACVRLGHEAYTDRRFEDGLGWHNHAVNTMPDKLRDGARTQAQKLLRDAAGDGILAAAAAGDAAGVKDGLTHIARLAPDSPAMAVWAEVTRRDAEKQLAAAQEREPEPPPRHAPSHELATQASPAGLIPFEQDLAVSGTRPAEQQPVDEVAMAPHPVTGLAMPAAEAAYLQSIRRYSTAYRHAQDRHDELDAAVFEQCHGNPAAFYARMYDIMEGEVLMGRLAHRRYNRERGVDPRDGTTRHGLFHLDANGWPQMGAHVGVRPGHSVALIGAPGSGKSESFLKPAVGTYSGKRVCAISVATPALIEPALTWAAIHNIPPDRIHEHILFYDPGKKVIQAGSPLLCKFPITLGCRDPARAREVAERFTGNANPAVARVENPDVWQKALANWMMLAAYLADRYDTIADEQAMEAGDITRAQHFGSRAMYEYMSSADIDKIGDALAWLWTYTDDPHTHPPEIIQAWNQLRVQVAEYGMTEKNWYRDLAAPCVGFLKDPEFQERTTWQHGEKVIDPFTLANTDEPMYVAIAVDTTEAKTVGIELVAFLDELVDAGHEHWLKNEAEKAAWADVGIHHEVDNALLIAVDEGITLPPWAIEPFNKAATTERAAGVQTIVCWQSKDLVKIVSGDNASMAEHYLNSVPYVFYLRDNDVNFADAISQRIGTYWHVNHAMTVIDAEQQSARATREINPADHWEPHPAPFGEEGGLGKMLRSIVHKHRTDKAYRENIAFREANHKNSLRTTNDTEHISRERIAPVDEVMSLPQGTAVMLGAPQGPLFVTSGDMDDQTTHYAALKRFAAEKYQGLLNASMVRPVDAIRTLRAGGVELPDELQRIEASLLARQTVANLADHQIKDRPLPPELAEVVETVPHEKLAELDPLAAGELPAHPRFWFTPEYALPDGEFPQEWDGPTAEAWRAGQAARFRAVSSQPAERKPAIERPDPASAARTLAEAYLNRQREQALQPNQPNPQHRQGPAAPPSPTGHGM